MIKGHSYLYPHLKLKEFFYSLNEKNFGEIIDPLGGIKDLYFGGNMNAAPALAGQSIGLISKVLPVEKIIKQTMEEFNSVCDALSNSKFEL